MTQSQTATLQVNHYYTFLREYGPRFEVIMGGAGSGKSHAVAQHIILSAIDPANRKRKYLCVRKVARTLRHSVFSLLRSIIAETGLGPFFSVNKTDMVIQCVNGAELILVGLDDVEKLKSIVGITDVWIEEATEISESDLMQLNLRLRGGTHKKRIVLTFNPISVTHWLKSYFFDNPKANARTHVTTYRDNAFLDDEYVAELEALKDIDSYFYDVYALGKWGLLGNIVFTNVVIHDFDYDETTLENVSAGMDFGVAHASAIERLGFRDGEIYSFDEVWGKGWTNSRFIEVAREHFGDTLYAIDITADSADPDKIKEWCDAGYRVSGAKKGDGSLRFGIDYLSRAKWHIHATKCPNLAREVQAFKRREDKDGNMLDAFVEINDDGIAAARYATEWIWGQYHGGIANYPYGAEYLGL